MKREQHTSILTALSTLFVITWCATHALGGVSLVPIPLAAHDPGADDLDNQGRAITWDGKYVVGFQGTNSMTYYTNGSAGFLYDVVNNVLKCDIIDSWPSAYAGTMTGIGYRREGATPQLIISGGDQAYHACWMTPDGGTTWGGKVRESTGTIPTPCGQNGLGASGESDVFYSAYIDAWDMDHAWHCYVLKYSGAWPIGAGQVGPTGTPFFNKDITQGLTAAMNGISASGRVVGWRQLSTTGTYKNNWILDWDSVQPKSYTFGGLVADVPDTEGQA